MFFYKLFKLPVAVFLLVIVVVRSQPNDDSDSDSDSEFEFKIIGGKKTLIEKHPYAVSVTYHGNHACGGSVINTRHVLTAAHCVYRNAKQNPKSIQRYFHIRAGISHISTVEKILTTAEMTQLLAKEDAKTHRNIYTLEFAMPHPEFNEHNFSNDICVLRTTQPFVYNKRILPIALPASDFQLPFGEMAQVSGWGVTEFEGNRTEQLQTVNVTVFDWPHCEAIYRAMDRQFSEEMFCAGDNETRRDACSGDSGGALVFAPTSAEGHKIGRIIIGVVSWGYKCGDKQHPGVYTNVAMFVDWINEIMQKPYQ